MPFILACKVEINLIHVIVDMIHVIVDMIHVIVEIWTKFAKVTASLG